MSVAAFMEENFKHFNARETLDASRAWVEFLAKGNKMFLSMAGAMSTGEIGISLAKMIREGKVHAISCTGANLEEDVFNLVAHNQYKMVPHYRDLSPEEEQNLLDQGFNRVTDTCIPEDVMTSVDEKLVQYWQEADQKGESHLPSEYFFRLVKDGVLDELRQIPREHSWVIAAYEMGVPIYTPGWEDSTEGNSFAAEVIAGSLKSHHAVKHGTEQFEHLIHWYIENSRDCEIGFFQIGGGIAGDFAICCVPSIIQDLPIAEEGKPLEKRLVKDPDHPCKLWGYFCQIGDSTTSYGSYSGAEPNEKITWSKLDVASPKFMINSDASIVAPLVFQYVLERSAESVKNMKKAKEKQKTLVRV